MATKDSIWCLVKVRLLYIPAYYIFLSGPVLLCSRCISLYSRFSALIDYFGLDLSFAPIFFMGMGLRRVLADI